MPQTKAAVTAIFKEIKGCSDQWLPMILEKYLHVQEPEASVQKKIKNSTASDSASASTPKLAWQYHNMPCFCKH